MDYKGPKRRLELSSCREQDSSESNPQREAPKCPRIDYAENEFQEFYDLLCGIEATQKFLKQKGMDCYNSSADANISRSSWKPSLAWEDFSTSSPSTGKDCVCEQGDLRSLKVQRQRDIPSPTNQVRIVESFDLNVEATPEQEISGTDHRM